MKGLLWFAAALALIAGAAAPKASDEWTVVIMGDTQGYLSPCGCTYPMTGGIVRRAQALTGLDPKRTVVLDTGQLSGGIGRQSEMKAECLAEAMASFRVDAAVLRSQDFQLGPGFVTNLASLGKFAWISSLADTGSVAIQAVFSKGPVNVFVGSAVEDRAWDEPGSVVLIEGGIEKARSLASRHPGIALIAYHSSPASREPEFVGKTILVSCGERGKAIIKAKWSAGRFVTAETVGLGPALDHQTHSPAAAEVAKTFRRYIGRVEREKLVEAMPRSATADFSGSKACAPCHASADAAWRKSGHAHALKTLEDKGQARDPECLPCHVVGLASTVGFKDRKLTPDLADVGCEACHGPLFKHVAVPASEKPPKVGKEACLKCHDLEHSPGFDFDRAWIKVAH